MNDRRIELRIAGRPRDIGGFNVRRLLPVAKKRSVGSFVFLDHMGPVVLPAGEGMDVKPHPHIGLATVTYLYEGAIMHRDSLGTEQEIHPGDVNLMTSGRGITHSERSGDQSRQKEERINGLQMWVALPKEHEDIEPFFTHVPKNDLPEISGEGWSGRLVAGSLSGYTSPAELLSRFFFVDIRAQADAVFDLEPDYEEVAVYVVDGALEIDGENVAEGELVVLGAGDIVKIKSLRPSIFAVLGGDALPEPRFMYWNFVSTKKEAIEQAKDDWRHQRFDKVAGDEDYTPLPDS
ncbi:MAG: pirin family protein [Proteobacteria bacterium]|nr:pirin family protein [Pseudomonadota bacterium]